MVESKQALEKDGGLKRETVMMWGKKEKLKLVIIGHVDHGKSTLIGRLLLDTNSLPKEKLEELKKISEELGKETELAYLSDQLKEEREQNKTIDTTQLFFKSKKREYIIIDAPGHAEFIKNMLTGASLAQAAVLIVDTKEGIMEQTRRHAYLIKMLGVENIIVVFNKMDLVNYSVKRFEEIKKEFLSFLGNLHIKPLFIIPVSARTGLNISKRSSLAPWYKGPFLLQALDSLTVRKSKKDNPLRFCVQDIYKNNDGEIIVGKVISGILKQGEEALLMPLYGKIKIKSIKIFPKNVKQASEGENIGLIIDGAAKITRGDIIVQKKNPPQALSSFEGNIFWMSEEPLVANTAVTVRCSTQESNCIVEKIQKRVNSSTLETIEENGREVRMNEAAVVTFKTEKPIVIEKLSCTEELGRFTLERGRNPQGIGIIT